MKLSQLVRRSVQYYLASNVGVLVGAAVSAAVLVGALAVGDSTRISLREHALERLAGAVAVISSGDRYFEDTLGERFQEPGSPDPKVEASVLLELPGTAARQDATARANAVRVIGVPPHFLPSIDVSKAGGVWLNETLAAQLRVRANDEVVLRVHKPSALSRDAVITPRDTVAVALRVRVAGIIGAREGGNLALQAGQTPPLNAFLSRDALATSAGLEGRGNLVWFRPASDDDQNPETSKIAERLTRKLREVWRLGDAELVLRPLPGRETGSELISRRIFLDREVAVAARKAAVGSPGIPGSEPILTYLVNAIIAAGREAPYSMVTAAGPPFTPATLSDEEIVVNQWLADDLKVRQGDMVDLAYFVADTGPQLVERIHRFRVREVVPLAGVYSDRSLMPEFPGIAKAESTQDWDAGFPLSRKIRAEDEGYWKLWRGTPKAFVTLSAGQKMWGNRFGELTALRWNADSGGNRTMSNRLAEAIRAELDPAAVGLSVDPVRDRVLQAAAGGQDFGSLFLGFSFFLLGSSLLLTALLFQFALERRAGEIGILLALGWPASRVRLLLLWEGMVLAVLGSVIGTILGIAYAKGVLWGLRTIWSAAVSGAALEYHVYLPTLAGGFAVSVLAAMLAIAFTLRRLTRRPAREILAEGTLDSALASNRGIGWVGKGIAGLAALAALGLTATAAGSRGGDPGLFFGAGVLWLLAGLLGSRLWLRNRASNRGRHRDHGGMGRLARRGLARRPSRSLGAMALLASAAFLLAAVGVFKLNSTAGAGRRDSGTGGFALWARSALPVLKDLNTEDGLGFYGISSADLPKVDIVPFRVHEGDDASCLNLSRAQRPRLLGVAPELLSNRAAFLFSEIEAGRKETNGWLLLAVPEIVGAGAKDETPAIGDAASLQWILHKQVGDTLDYLDERGRPFKVRIVGALDSSVLQGNLLVAESELIRRYPSETGHREFLIDMPQGQESIVSAVLSRALQDVGFETTPTWVRMAQFNAVQNTYLDTFQVLGGLGLLLGSAGFGVIVLRNLQERRGEFGLMLALGFQRGSLVRLAMTENGLLLAAGLALGIGAAAVAVFPSLRPAGPPLPWLSLGITLGLVAANGLLWTWIAARWSTRGGLLAALRDL